MSSPESARRRRLALAQAQGRTLREYKPTGLSVDDKTAWRREYKRMQRRKEGARLRAEMSVDAQAKRETIAAIRLQKQKYALHDAHVKRYAKVLSARASSARKYAQNPQLQRDRQSKRKHALVDSYVIYNLKATGVPAAAITPRLIALKREAMEYHRISKTIKTAIKTNWKENNETITKHP